MYKSVERILRVHPLPWDVTHDLRGNVRVVDANGIVVCYTQGKLSLQLADLIASVISYHSEE